MENENKVVVRLCSSCGKVVGEFVWLEIQRILILMKVSAVAENVEGV